MARFMKACSNTAGSALGSWKSRDNSVTSLTPCDRASASTTGMIASSNPAGAVISAGAAALGQSFLNLYGASGGIPYTNETSTIIDDALDAYEASVNTMPPTTVAQALSYVDDEWFLCSPGGYAELATKAIGTATVSGSGGASSSASFATRAVPAGRPKVFVNGR